MLPVRFLYAVTYIGNQIKPRSTTNQLIRTGTLSRFQSWKLWGSRSTLFFSVNARSCTTCGLGRSSYLHESNLIASYPFCREICEWRESRQSTTRLFEAPRSGEPVPLHLAWILGTRSINHVDWLTTPRLRGYYGWYAISAGDMQAAFYPSWDPFFPGASNEPWYTPFCPESPEYLKFRLPLRYPTTRFLFDFAGLEAKFGHSIRHHLGKPSTVNRIWSWGNWSPIWGYYSTSLKMRRWKSQWGCNWLLAGDQCWCCVQWSCRDLWMDSLCIRYVLLNHLWITSFLLLPLLRTHSPTRSSKTIKVLRTFADFNQTKHAQVWICVQSRSQELLPSRISHEDIYKFK